MALASESEKTAKTHNQRTPFNWVDVAAVLHQQFLGDMQLHDVNLEHVGVHVLAEGTHGVHAPRPATRCFSVRFFRFSPSYRDTPGPSFFRGRNSCRD